MPRIWYVERRRAGLHRPVLPRAAVRRVPAAADGADGRDAAMRSPAGSRARRTAFRGSGFFYTANIAGAVFGCLLAGFYLLRLYDMATATFVGAAINALCGVLALVLAAVASHDAPAAAASAGRRAWRPGVVAVYLTIALSGLTALGAEVVWTRLLSLLLGASVYTFSIILAVFLLGLGTRQQCRDRCSRAGSDPRVALGWSQALLVARHWLGRRSASRPGCRSGRSIRCSASIRGSPSSSIWCAACGRCCRRHACGARAFRSRSRPWPRTHEDTGRAVGAVYAANTVGAIVGALTFSMILIPTLGTLWSQRILMAIAALAAIVMLAAACAARTPRAAGCRWSRARVPLAAIPVATALLALRSAGRSRRTVRLWPQSDGAGIRGRRCSMSARASMRPSRCREREDGVRSFSRERQDRGHERAASTCACSACSAICRRCCIQSRAPCWSSASAPASRPARSCTYPEIERIVICEIEPLIPQIDRDVISARRTTTC